LHNLIELNQFNLSGPFEVRNFPHAKATTDFAALAAPLKPRPFKRDQNPSLSASSSGAHNSASENMYSKNSIAIISPTN
jgi:hypothetical protein